MKLTEADAYFCTAWRRRVNEAAGASCWNRLLPKYLMLQTTQTSTTRLLGGRAPRRLEQTPTSTRAAGEAGVVRNGTMKRICGIGGARRVIQLLRGLSRSHCPHRHLCRETRTMQLFVDRVSRLADGDPRRKAAEEEQLTEVGRTHSIH